MPGESHGQRTLGGYSPQGHEELDTAECTGRHAHTVFPLVISGWTIKRLSAKEMTMERVRNLYEDQKDHSRLLIEIASFISEHGL